MARKYLVSGDLKLELWYDENGAWLKWRMHHRQGAVTMTLTRSYANPAL
jgi:hypothetical protein